MAKPSYESLVKQGRQAAKSQWTLGDLASKVETSYGEGKLQEYADDIGVEYRTLLDYRRVALAYEKSERSDLPWSVHAILAPQDDRAGLVKDDKLTASVARALVRGRKEASALPGEPPIEEETWLGRAYPQIRHIIKERTGLDPPEHARVSIGWPRSKSKKSGTDTIGEAWVAGALDKVPQIYISPQVGDAERALDVLAHEGLHLGLPKAGHDKKFAAAASKLGLQGDPTETFAGPALKVVLRDLAEELGPYPHSPIELPKEAKPKPREGEPNKAKYVCVDCQSMNGDGEGYTVPVGPISRTWLEHGWPIIRCPIDDKLMEIIDD